MKLIKGVNDIVTLFPDLIKEWDFGLNEKTPDNYTKGSNYVAHWICDKGHKYTAQICERVRGSGCPFCAGKKVSPEYHNDLLSLNPELAKEWNYEKNNPLTPDVVSPGSPKKVWWKCKHGHEWRAAISSRNAGNGCPVCSNFLVVEGVNDLATVNPELAKEWNYEKNNPLTPKQVTGGSTKVVWWKCNSGHEWKASIVNRNNTNSSCPFCLGKRVIKGVNDLKTKYPEIAKEFDDDKNDGLTPSDIMPSTKKKIWWRCPKGHSYLMSPANRVQLHENCPECKKYLKTSFPEQTVLFYLSQIFPDVDNRYSNKDLGISEIDIFIPSMKCGVEYNGYLYHQNSQSDRTKLDNCRKAGIRLIRVIESKTVDGVNVDADDIYIQNPVKNDYLVKCICLICDLLECKRPDINIERDEREIISLFKKGTVKNNLLEVNPALCQEWNTAKNGKMTPDSISANSHINVWWKCRECGFEWVARVGARNAGQGCPACANHVVFEGKNDLATLYPDQIKYFDSDKNGVTPNKVVAGGLKKYWWKCPECGYEWQAIMANRLKKGKKCPKCRK